jgi:hypothetical protein
MMTEKEIAECRAILAARKAASHKLAEERRTAARLAEEKSARFARWTEMLQNQESNKPRVGGRPTPVEIPVQQGPLKGKNSSLPRLQQVWA